MEILGLGAKTPAAPPPPPPAPTIDEAARRRQAADAMSRKRGQAASVLTGPEGVGPTPVQTKTLIGS